MTDRELLELAAKAAGHEFLYFAPTLDGSGEYLRIKDLPDRWNPLADDGDALRLAVTLGERYPCAVIGIFNRAVPPHASASVVLKDGSETFIEHQVESDMAAATRRAIVRAAAEIGKSMETK